MTGPATSRESDEAMLVDSQGRPELFTSFYDRHARPLLAFFARRTFDAQVAADLTAETFAEAYACRGRYKDRGDGSAAAWLYTIGRRQLAHYVRHSRVEQGYRARLHMPRSRGRERRHREDRGADRLRGGRPRRRCGVRSTSVPIRGKR